MRHLFLPFPPVDLKKQGSASETVGAQTSGSQTSDAAQLQDGCTNSSEEMVAGACCMAETDPAEHIDHKPQRLWTQPDQIEFQATGEGDVEQECGTAWETCTKYPDHQGFIALPEFSLHHLPQRFQSEDVLNYIKVRADLTVRLRIKVSSGRPENDPFAKHAGFTGTAWIGDVSHSLDRNCFCKNCKTQEPPRRDYWYFLLHSATHCIYDEIEADNVRIDFFYDSKEAMRSGKMKTLRGVRMLGAFRTEDICMMECATHDEDLGRYLMQKFEESSQLERMFSSNPCSLSATSENNKVMVCVSHPHGTSKQVTVGDLRHQYEITYQEPGMSLFALMDRAESGIHYRLSDYDTRTCPGSSGAAVICLDKMMSCDVKDWLMLFCTHLRANPPKGLNTGLDISIESLNDYLEDRVKRRITSVDDMRESMQKTWVD